MELRVKLDIKEGRIRLNKVLNALDEFVIGFVSVLDRNRIEYVLVSGYVPILFGRSRSSEDVDIIIERLDYGRFQNVWDAILKRFECVNVTKAEDAYHNYLLTGHSVRFSKAGSFIPNMEVKFPKNGLDEWTLSEKRLVSVNGKNLSISPLELQIPYKLFLGSEKDIEDAKYLYGLFKGRLDKHLMDTFVSRMGVVPLFDRYFR